MSRRPIDSFAVSTQICVLTVFAFALIAADMAAAQTILFVRDSSSSYSSSEQSRVTLFEGWGYTVTPINDGATQGEFDTAIASANVAYVPSTIDDWQLVYKLRTASCGVLVETVGLDTEFGFASGDGYTQTDNDMDNVDNSHPVTAGVSSGSVTILSSNQPLAVNNNSLASGMEVLGERNFGGMCLGVMDSGATLANSYNGNSSASGKRVRLPWGGNPFYVSSLDSDGTSILQNALSWAGGLSGGTSDAEVYLSTENSSVIGGAAVADEDLVEYDTSGGTGTIIFDGSVQFTGTAPDINAVHAFSDGTFYFSADSSGTLAGVSFQDEDIVKYDPSTNTATLLFDGTSVFSTDTDVSALFVMDNGHVLLSTTNSTSISGLNFNDEDVVEYNPSTGTASMYFNGSAVFSSNEDVDAVYLLDNGNLLVSTDTSAQIGGLSFNDEDVVEYDGSTASMYFNGSSHYSSDEDTNAFSLIDQAPALIAHWKFDESSGTTVADSSDDANDAAFSSGSPNWVTGVRGGALEFNGSSDEVDTDAAFNPPETGTLTFWFKADGPPASRERMFGSSMSWEVRYETSGRLEFDICNNDGPTSVKEFTLPNRWNHVAFIYNKNAGTYTTYVNGKYDWSGTYTMADEGAGILTFGTRTGSTQNFAGALDDVRVYDYELTEAEVAEVYGLVGHWKLDESSGTTAADSSLVGNDGAYAGSASPGGAGPYPSLGVVAGDFDGAGSHIAVPHHEAYKIAEHFTIASWVRCDTWQDLATILTSGPLAGAVRLSLGESVAEEQVFRVQVNVNPSSLTDPGSYGHWLSYGSGQQVDTWYHVALVGDGTYLRLYINGVEFIQWEHSDGFGTHSEGLLVGEGLDGRLFDVRLYNRALKDDEIAELHGLVGHWKLDETSGVAAIDSSGMGKHGTYSGGVLLNQSGPNSSLAAPQFDGADGHVSLPSYTTDFRNGYAIAVWGKPTSTGYWERFLELGDGIDAHNFFLTRYGTDATLDSSIHGGSLGGTQRLDALNAIVNNEWHHYVASVSSTGFGRLYVDGVEVATGGIGTPGKASRTLNYIGKSNWGVDANFQGQMWDVRLYNRPVSVEEVQALYQAGVFQGVRIIRWVEAR